MRKMGIVLLGMALIISLLAAAALYIGPSRLSALVSENVLAETNQSHTATTKPLPTPTARQIATHPFAAGEASIAQQKAAYAYAEQQHQAYLNSLPTSPGKEIAAFSTSLAGHSASGRVHNIELAAQKINGRILLPGDEFSFNQTTGDSNQPSSGWQLATVIVGKEFVQGYGGGICQVSSTMYNAVLGAGLDVTERYSHSLPVGYVAPGHDATVSYPELDFKFINTLTAPVRLEVKVSNGRVVCALYQLPQEA